MSYKEKLEIQEQIIQAALIIKPFKVHEYLLTHDWSNMFFLNLELLNGYSFADFCLADPAFIKRSLTDQQVYQGLLTP
jgi:hypothetical protein